MKSIVLLLLCNLISMNFIYAEKCYVCDQSGCERPGVGDIQTCTDNDVGGKSGKAFVKGALGKGDDVYTSMANQLSAHIDSLNLNSTIVTWKALTGWVCYVTNDKRRGCLLTGKGLCAGDRSWLAKITSFGGKITGLMDKAASAVGSMFTGEDVKSVDNDQKTNISRWMAANYMAKLVNNSAETQFQLDYCCEGDECNSNSMIQKSSTVLIVLLLSVFLFV